MIVDELDPYASGDSVQIRPMIFTQQHQHGMTMLPEDAAVIAHHLPASTRRIPQDTVNDSHLLEQNQCRKAEKGKESHHIGDGGQDNAAGQGWVYVEFAQHQGYRHTGQGGA